MATLTCLSQPCITPSTRANISPLSQEQKTTTPLFQKSQSKFGVKISHIKIVQNMSASATFNVAPSQETNVIQGEGGDGDSERIEERRK
jgi:hypothetical protein